MCFDPLTLGTGVLQYGMNVFDASRANDQRRKDYAVAAELTNEQVVQNYLSMALKQSSEIEASHQRVQDMADQTREAMGIARTRAAASGVTGNSVQAMLQEFERDQGYFSAMETRNLQIAEANNVIEGQQIYTKAQASLFQARPQMVQPQNPLGAALQIGLQAYNKSQENAWKETVTKNLNDGK